MVRSSFLSLRSLFSRTVHGSITSSQFCQVSRSPGRTAILYGAPLSNGQVNVGCGGTCTGEGGAVILIVPRAVPSLLAPLALNRTFPWASPRTPYEPPAAPTPLPPPPDHPPLLPPLFWTPPAHTS